MTGMGYKNTMKVYRLTWDDSTEFPGLVATMRGARVREILAVSELADQAGAENMTSIRALFGQIAEFLTSWNVETEDGDPVPATEYGLYEVELALVLAIVNAWVEAAGGVSGPLSERSSSGGTSAVPPLPMAPLSASQAS